MIVDRLRDQSIDWLMIGMGLSRDAPRENARVQGVRFHCEKVGLLLYFGPVFLQQINLPLI